MFGRISVLAFMSRQQALPDFEFCGILIVADGEILNKDEDTLTE